jgi:hypothetical protein
MLQTDVSNTVFISIAASTTPKRLKYTPEMQITQFYNCVEYNH